MKILLYDDFTKLFSESYMCNSNKAGLDFMDISEFDREPD